MSKINSENRENSLWPNTNDLQLAISLINIDYQHSFPREQPTLDVLTIITIQSFSPMLYTKNNFYSSQPPKFEPKSHTYDIKTYQHRQPQTVDMTSNLLKVQEKMTNTLHRTQQRSSTDCHMNELKTYRWQFRKIYFLATASQKSLQTDGQCP